MTLLGVRHVREQIAHVHTCVRPVAAVTANVVSYGYIRD